MAVTLQFRHKHGRDPTLWLVKVCINQKEISRTLRCLPVFVQSCTKLLILGGDSYVNRLWCAYHAWHGIVLCPARLLKLATTA